MGRIVVLFVVFFAAVLSACPIGWKELADGCQLQSTDSADDTQVQQPTVTEVFNSDENPDRPAHEEVVEDTYNETTTVGSTQEGTEAGSLETDAGHEEVKKHSWDELEAEEEWEETDLGDGIAEETDLVGEETTTEIDGGEETTMETDVTTSVAGVSVTCTNGKCTREKLFEEDMALSDSQLEFLMNVDEGETKKASAALSSRWPRGIILYELTPGVTRLRSTILRAMKHWEESTCLTFLDYKDPAARRRAGHNKRARFVRQTRCYSQVGVQASGITLVSLGQGCGTFGGILHEIGHVIGLWHEQSRPDRDKYVRIHYENIKAGKQKHFQKYDASVIKTYGVPYDIGSIMHSPSTMHSKNGKRTIEARDPSEQSEMGQRREVTTADARIVNLMYRCPATTSDRCNSRCFHGHHNHRCHCVCRHGYFGHHCEYRHHHRDQQSCGGVISGQSEGVISLPQEAEFSDMFDSDSAADIKKCSWTILAKPDDVIRLNVDDFDFGDAGRCDRASLVVDDGESERVFCGKKSDIPAEFVAKDGVLSVEATFQCLQPGRCIPWWRLKKETSDPTPSLHAPAEGVAPTGVSNAEPVWDTVKVKCCIKVAGVLTCTFEFTKDCKAKEAQANEESPPMPSLKFHFSVESNPASEHSDPSNAEGRLRLPADTNCGGLLRTTGVIASSNYPKSYSSNLNCAWLIEAPSGGRVRLMKGDFDLEQSSFCESDYVTVSGAFVSNRFCGRAETFPRSLVSVANQLLVRFKTDASKMLKGFRLPFYIV